MTKHSLTSEQRQNRTIIGFILLSMLLHLILLIIPKDSIFPRPAVPEPVYVEVRPPQLRDRELDIPIRKELEKPRTKPAKRLAEKDQVVEQEMAPEGQDTEDRQQSQASKPTQQTPPPSPAQKESQPAEKQVATKSPVTADGWQKQKKKTQPKTDLPDLKTLTQISQNTLEQIDSDWRSKYRKDVAKGDTVWMDTESDLLISFMRRFRTNIYNVWNYPAAASERGHQGKCLLRITVNRQGGIEDVRVLESSGYRALDDEAVRAVRKGATYGPLPKAYPNPELKIMAFFEYRTDRGGRSARRRPGRVY